MPFCSKVQRRCDQCRLCYHFGCLDPPLKKSPKQTGYGWICQECDTSSSKEEEEDPKEQDNDHAPAAASDAPDAPASAAADVKEESAEEDMQTLD